MKNHYFQIKKNKNNKRDKREREINHHQGEPREEIVRVRESER